MWGWRHVQNDHPEQGSTALQLSFSDIKNTVHLYLTRRFNLYVAPSTYKVYYTIVLTLIHTAPRFSLVTYLLIEK